MAVGLLLAITTFADVAAGAQHCLRTRAGSCAHRHYFTPSLLAGSARLGLAGTAGQVCPCQTGSAAHCLLWSGVPHEQL